MRLANRVIGITGGASGIGRACALAAAAEGADLALGDIDAEGLAKTASEIQDLGRRAVTRIVDVTTDDDQEALVELAVNELGGLDGWVGSAGTGSGQFALEHTRAEWRRVMEVNVEGVFFGAQAAGRHMVTTGSGSIVTVASMYGQRAVKQRAAYCTSKASVVMLSQVLALELAEHGVRVNALAPGYTDTPLFNIGKERDSVEIDRLISHVPFKRLAVPEEIASAAIFLLSDEAGFVTGHVLTVDGGWVAHGPRE